MNIEEYWNRFIKDKNLPIGTKYIESFKFGYTDEQADELLYLVLKGKKIATTSPYFEYEESIKVGDYSIVLDSKNNPKCVIQTTNVQILPFNKATFDLIKDEGEDEIFDSWHKNHEIFLKEKCRESNVEYKDDILIIFEHFKVVYK